MKDGVFDAPDVLIDGQPAIGRRADGLGGVRVGEAGEIPRGIDEGVQSIGLTLGIGGTAPISRLRLA